MENIFHNKDKFNGTKLIAAGAGTLLVSILILSLIINYRAQTDLQQVFLDRMALTLKNQAKEAGHFFTELRQDMLILSASREIISYHENIDLGMTMTYGLQASLALIEKRFTALIDLRTVEERPVYEGFMLLDNTGKIIASSGKTISQNFIFDTDWKRNPSAPFLIQIETGLTLILKAVPYQFKKKAKGWIVGVIAPQTVLAEIRAGRKPGRSPAMLYGGTKAFTIGMPPDLAARLNMAPANTLTQFHIQDPVKGQTEYSGGRYSIEGTPFFMAQALPSNELIGQLRPWHLLVAMGALLTLTIAVCIFFLKMASVELVLTTRLSEESIRKAEIQNRNNQLEVEIQLRSQLEQTLKESEEKFRRISLAALDGIIMLDQEGKILFWNPAATKIFGFSNKEALGKCFHSKMTTRRSYRIFKKNFGGLETSEAPIHLGQSFELEGKQKNGEYFPAELSVSTVEMGKNRNTLIIVRDITKRKQKDKELERHRNHLKDLVTERTRELEQAQQKIVANALEAGRAELSAMILHNIGNAITPVSVTIETLKSRQETKLQGYMASCYDDLMNHKDNLSSYISDDSRGIKVIEYMGHLIDSFDAENCQTDKLVNKLGTSINFVTSVLAVQKNYAPDILQNKERINLNKLINDTVKIQEKSLLNCGIRVVTKLSSPPPYLLIEKDKLMQVVVNLIKNSCDAIESHSGRMDNHAIAITTFITQEGVGISISDTGIGVPAHQLDTIFDFGVSTNGTSGFGLYYAKNFVEPRGGSLTLESSGLGLGACVTLKFLTSKLHTLGEQV